MSIWDCSNCKETFDEKECGDRTYYEPYEFWGVRGTEKITVLTCPYCGSEDIGPAGIDEKSGDL